MDDRILPMEGLRGIAVTLVFLVHYAALASNVPHLGEALKEAGHHGVDLFFVLSGYLIYRAAMTPSLDLRRFLVRRAQRIYPAFLAVFSAYLVLSAALPVESKIPADPGRAAAYIAANVLLLPGLFPIQPIIIVAWSLSYELAYYIACPMLVILLGIRRRSWRWRVTFWLAVTAGFFVLPGDLRAVMFVCGILLYEVLHGTRLTVPAWLAGGLTSVVLATAGMHVLVGPPKFAALFVAFLLLCLAAFRGGGLAAPLSWGPLRWLGRISYSYYLIHGLALKAIFFVAPLAYGPWLLPAFGLTLLAGAGLHYTVERPMSLSRPTSCIPPGTPLRNSGLTPYRG